MASIRRETLIDAPPDDVWSALRDWGALHERLVPGFVVDTRLDGDVRIVTFGSGTVLRERLVDLDDETRRIVWSVVDGPYAHHNASAQVLAEEDGRARFVWIADLLPDDLADSTGDAMTVGTDVVRKTLEVRAEQHGGSADRPRHKYAAAAPRNSGSPPHVLPTRRGGDG